MNRKTIISSMLLCCFINGFAQMKEKVDLIVTNGVIYTVDSRNSTAGSMVIKNGKILAIGKDRIISDGYQADSTIDLGGKAVFPGFIDAHCHFLGFALGLQFIDLRGSKSFEEVLQRLQTKKGTVATQWIVGRGWDQNLWVGKHFPDNNQLDQLFPKTPVMLIRVDGHVVLANRAALTLAGIGKDHHFKAMEVEVKDGRLTGILSETAADLMRDAVPKPNGKELIDLVKEAEQQCFSKGLTIVSDAGLDHSQVKFIDSIQRSGILNMQMYCMLTPTKKNLKEFVKNGPYITDKLMVRSIKVYADGSLGSHTAALKHSYTDEPYGSGIIVTTPDSLRLLCKLALEHGYQVNTHCIGDSANKLVLDIYGSFLKGRNDHRWRIEHAQVVDPADLHLFGEYSVIPSVQATHATSDMYWAERRLGPIRIKGAYAYKLLLRQNGWIANGTDFPVENISPLFTFYASVTRQDLQGFPEGGFQMENSLSREETLRSITIWAAKADFMEKQKGSLEVGKDADFIILDQDIMRIPVRSIPDIKVIKTFIGGKEVFSLKNVN